MASPSLLDFDRLLSPIAGENPCGSDLRWDAVYQEIKDARKQGDRDMLGMDEPDVANWHLVIDLTSNSLTNKSKDLMVSAWLTEALTHAHGFAGLRDGLSMISQLLEKFWDGLYPLIDGEDLEPRVAPLVWLTDADRGARLPNSLRDIALTTAGDEVYSWSYWKSRFAKPKGNEEDEGAYEIRRLEAEERGKRFETAVSKTSREFAENLYYDVHQCTEALTALDKILDAVFTANMAPGTSALRQVLGECEVLVRRIVKDKGGFTGDEPAAAAGEAATPNGQPKSFSGPIQSREQAFQKLAEVAAFLRHTEPQSPVSYLIERAVVWGRMPFEQLLSELIKDTGVRGQVGELLGIRNAPPEEST